MDLRDTIYVLTVFQEIDETNYGYIDVGDYRCIAWYNSHEEAEKVVMRNPDCIFDMGYMYCVIETVKSGLYPRVSERVIYKYNKQDKVFNKQDEDPFGDCYALSIG